MLCGAVLCRGQDLQHLGAVLGCLQLVLSKQHSTSIARLREPCFLRQRSGHVTSAIEVSRPLSACSLSAG